MAPRRCPQSLPPLYSVSRTFPGGLNGLDPLSVLWFRSVSPCVTPTLILRSLCQAYKGSPCPPCIAHKRGTRCRAPSPAAGPVPTRQPRPQHLPVCPPSLSSDVRQETRGWGRSGHAGHRGAWAPAARRQSRQPRHRRKGHFSGASLPSVGNVLFPPCFPNVPTWH